MATHSSILAWRTPWTEESGGHSPWGCKESDTTEVTKHAHFLSRVDIVLIWIYGAVESYQDPAEAKNRRC